MKSLTSVASGFCIVVALGSVALACGPTILWDDPSGSGAGGEGGGGIPNVGGNAPEPSSSTGTPLPNECPEECAPVSGDTVCSCTDTCFTNTRVVCEWTVNTLGETKLQCICTIKDTFSGACFQKDESLACDFQKGCCAKYFSGK